METAVILFIFGKISLRLDVSAFVLSEETIAALDKTQSTKSQHIGFGVLIVYLLALLLPGLFPTIPGMTILSKAGVVGISAVALLIMSLLVIDGKPLINLEKTFKKHSQWVLLLLLAVTFPLGDAFKSPDAGIVATINQVFLPLISDMGVTTFMILSIIILGLLTQVTHNVVLAATFMPILCPVCETLGGNGITMWFLLFLTLQCAYITPAASMQAAMIHGHERVIKNDIYILSSVFFITEIIVLSLIGIPLGNIMF